MKEVENSTNGDEIPSATVEATIRFADHAARSAFLDEYLGLTAGLIDEYAANDGDAHLAGLAVHPTDRETPRATMNPSPAENTRIVFTFEHTEGGTRIQVTQSGFDPAFVEMAGEDLWAHGHFSLMVANGSSSEAPLSRRHERARCASTIRASADECR